MSEDTAELGKKAVHFELDTPVWNVIQTEANKYGLYIHPFIRMKIIQWYNEELKDKYANVDKDIKRTSENDNPHIKLSRPE